jgi:hypothetical protein
MTLILDFMSLRLTHRGDLVEMPFFTLMMARFLVWMKHILFLASVMCAVDLNIMKFRMQNKSNDHLTSDQEHGLDQ